MKKLQLIDLVRTFCILSVLAVHSDAIFLKPSGGWSFWCWDHFQRNGMYGVYLFFGISGFLITGVIANNQGGLFKPSLRQFYVQRAGRILPLLILMIWIGFCMLQVQPSPSAHYLEVFHPLSGSLGLEFWLSISTFTFNWFRAFNPIVATCVYWDVLWSLCVEEQFYLLFPFLLRVSSNKKRLGSLLVAVVSLCFFWRIGCALWAPGDRYLQACTSLGAFDSIAIGALFYLANDHWNGYLARNKKVSVLICGIGFFVMGSVYLFADFSDFELIFAPALLNLGLALFLLGGIQLHLFESKWLKLFSLPGKYCYGGYLLHTLILSVAFPVLFHMNAWEGFGLFALLTMVVSGISYHFFEMPANRTIRSSFLP